MKTLQTQYNLIKEGKGSKHIFLKEAKGLYPDMITNFSTFEQTEKILKNRGVINENVVGLRPINDWEPSPKQDYEIAFKNMSFEMVYQEFSGFTMRIESLSEIEKMALGLYAFILVTENNELEIKVDDIGKARNIISSLFDYSEETMKT